MTLTAIDPDFCPACTFDDVTVEVIEANGCRILSADDAGLSPDVWEAVPRPFDNFIAILQYQPPAQSKGGIWLPQAARDDCETLGFVGQVLAMGPNCYRRDSFMVVEEVLEAGEWNNGSAPAIRSYHRYLPPPRCKVGDWVVFQRHEQFRAPVYGRDARRRRSPSASPSITASWRRHPARISSRSIWFDRPSTRRTCREKGLSS